MQLGDLKSAMERYRQLKQSQAQGQLPVQQNPDMLRQSMQARPRQAGMLETMMGVGRQFREDPLNALKVMANRAISGPETNVTTGLEPGPIEKFMGRGSRSIADSVQDFYSSKVPEFLARQNAPQAIQNIAKVGGAIAGTGSEIIAQSMDESSPAFSQAAFGFHGTPHKFNKFDIKKIGTGEGAQAYGHGLYFAENPAVAKEYMKIVPSANVPPRRTFHGKDLEPGTPEYHAGTILDHSSLKQARKKVKEWIDEIAQSPERAKEVGQFKKTLALLESAGSKSDFKMLKPQSHMYKVDIPDEKVAGMLDWDKPLSEQSESIRKGVESAIRDVRGGNKEITLELVSKNLGGNPTGADFYRMIAGTPEKSTQALQKQGIPGIKYLDQGSRGETVTLFTGKGKEYAKNKFDTMGQAQDYAKKKQAEGFTTKIGQEGTRNIVAFDDKIVNILEVNGKKVKK